MINNYMTFSEYIERGGILPPSLSNSIISPEGSNATLRVLLESVFSEAYVPVLVDEDPTAATNRFYSRLFRACRLLDFADAQAKDIRRMRGAVARGAYTELSSDVTAIRPNDGAINPVGGYVDGDTRTNAITTVESDAVDRYTAIDVYAPMYRPYIDLFRSCFVSTQVIGRC